MNTIAITQNIVKTFTKGSRISYAKDNDSIFISNGYYIFKSDNQGLDDLVLKVNNRRKKADIDVIEVKILLKYISDARGKFEVAKQPYELSVGERTEYLFADNKQYFAYNKMYVDIFYNQGCRLFVDDNSTYDTLAHNLIIKNDADEVLGVVSPISVTDEIYKNLANVLPLEIKWKSELERIRENPTNDPYIGKEFFDGRETHIVTSIRNQNRTNMYVISTVENGKLSRGADLVKVDEIEERIALWESNKIYWEECKEQDEIQAKKDAEIKAEYENTNGYTDNLPPMRKAKVLKTLNEIFRTKDYGALSYKQFISTTLEEGKTIDEYKFLKKKYAGMTASDYLHEVKWDAYGDLWRKYKAVTNDTESQDSPNALWLKENHPFLYYKLFDDKSVLDNSYFTTEYRLMLDDRRFYNIPKTVYDYGKYLLENSLVVMNKS